MRTCALIIMSVLFSGISVDNATAQSVAQENYTTIIDSGHLFAHGGSNNRKRIYLRVRVDQVMHSDGSRTNSLNFHAIADDQNAFGRWSFASELYNITYSISYAGVLLKSGSMSLDHMREKSAVAYDWSECLPGSPMLTPNLISLNVTAQRYGGATGISVSYRRP